MSDQCNATGCNSDDFEDQDNQAALLTELAELKLAAGKSEEAHKLLQQAFEIGLKTKLDNNTGLSHIPTSGQNSSTAVLNAGASDNQIPAEAAVVTEDLLQPSGEAWDRSDDWEPDLSHLRKASSLQRETAAVTAATAGPTEQPCSLQPSQVADHSRKVQQNSDSWQSGRTEGCSSRLSRSGSRSAGGTPSRPRGRGESRLQASSDSESEWDSIGAPQQPHILEIYGLHRGVKTSHLDEFLLDYLWDSTTANVRWVDDEHALAVFPCAEAAQQLLNSMQVRYKVRPYNKASGAALQIPVEELAPPRSARPKTTTAVARRLISNALGNKQVRDRAAEKELADLRKANKQEKQQRQHMMESVWGDE